MVARVGFEPTYDAVKVHCVAASPPSNKYFFSPNLHNPQWDGNPFLLITRELQLRSLFI